MASGDSIHYRDRSAAEDCVAAFWWTSGLVYGFFSAIVSAAMSAPRRTIAARAVKRLAYLEDAVIGNSKGVVATVFGPPPTALIPAVMGTADSAALFRADTWYYPLDAKRHRAMVIQFIGGIARTVEFIDVLKK